MKEKFIVTIVISQGRVISTVELSGKKHDTYNEALDEIKAASVQHEFYQIQKLFTNQ